MWDVVDHPVAAREYRCLDSREALAVDHAIDKLRILGPQLPFPHSSAVRGGDERLRELRPRGGRSRTRVFYRRIGNTFVIGAYGPEAQVDRQGFIRACRLAAERLDEVEE